MGVASLITGCGCGFVRMRIKTNQTSNKNFILKYFRCRDGKRTETRIGMEGICITHSCIPLYTVYMQHIMAHSGGMQEWVIQIPSIPILVSVLFPSLHLKYFRIKFLLLVTYIMGIKGVHNGGYARGCALGVNGIGVQEVQKGTSGMGNYMRMYNGYKRYPLRTSYYSRYIVLVRECVPLSVPLRISCTGDTKRVH